MAIVWPTALGVEQYAAAGRDVEVPRLGCPGCKEPMSYWGWYGRDVRVGRSRLLWVRRQRCRACQASHAVLPSFVAHGRLDAVGVIGPALEAMVAGRARAAADALGLPYTTVRDWRRRFGARAEMLALGAVRACVALGAPAPPAGGDGRGGGARGTAVGMAGGGAPLWPGRGRLVALRQRPRRRSPAHHQHTSALVKRLKVVLDAYGRASTGNGPTKEAFMANGHQDKAEQLALFRYQVISEAASPRLTPAERGRLARELAARTWVGPMGPSAR